jgi:hypothetical protein
MFCARTHFLRYRGRRVPFSCFVLLKLFSALPSALGPFFMLYALGLVFGGTEGHPIPFSCFPLTDMFSVVPRASGPVFMICAPGLIFGGTEGVGSRFHVLRSRTCFRRYRGRRVPFSCFALSDSFSAVPRESGSVYMFCPPELVFDGTEGVRSRFHVMRSRNHFRRCRVHRVPFSCFSLPDMFSAVTRA